MTIFSSKYVHDTQIAVLDKGMLVEYDSPYELLQKEGGYFHGLVAELGPDAASRLEAIAKEASSQWGPTATPTIPVLTTSESGKDEGEEEEEEAEQQQEEGRRRTVQKSASNLDGAIEMDENSSSRKMMTAGDEDDDGMIKEATTAAWR